MQAGDEHRKARRHSWKVCRASYPYLQFETRSVLCFFDQLAATTRSGDISASVTSSCFSSWSTVGISRRRTLFLRANYWECIEPQSDGRTMQRITHAPSPSTNLTNTDPPDATAALDFHILPLVVTKTRLACYHELQQRSQGHHVLTNGNREYMV